jgi:hypothetical protein
MAWCACHAMARFTERIIMKSGLILTSLALLGPFNPLWLPYGAFVPNSAGNPNWDSYAGQAGSTYDAAANPPKTNGPAAYNPYAPLPSVAPAAPSGSANIAAPPR